MFSKLIFVGRLGGEPELQFAKSGTAVCHFSLAVDSGYGEKKETMWFRVTAFGKTGEIVNEYKHKGDIVAIVADRIKASPYIDKAGKPAASLEVIAREVSFIGGGKNVDVDYDAIEPIPF